MCGRYVMTRSTGDLVAALDIEHVVGEDLRPSWNAAPTQNVRIITGRGPDGEPPGRRLETACWGLVPAWVKSRSVGSRAINARAETVVYGQWLFQYSAGGISGVGTQTPDLERLRFPQGDRLAERSA